MTPQAPHDQPLRSVSTHPTLHVVSVHVPAHEPSVHADVARHRRPQVPQFIRSVFGLMHTPSQQMLHEGQSGQPHSPL